MYKKITSLILSLTLLSASFSACTRENPPQSDSLTNNFSLTLDTPLTPDSTKTYDEAVNIDKLSASEKAEKITVSSTDITVYEGETAVITAEILPTNEKAVWTSSDRATADVSADGIVTGVKEGKCIITVTAASNEALTKSIKVTVRKKIPQASVSDDTESGHNAAHRVKSITLNYTAITLAVGETATPVVTLEPSDNLDNDKIKWSSSNDFIAAVDSSGCITAYEEGSCIITAVSDDNKDASAKIDVTVTKPHESAITDENIDTQQQLYIDGILIVNKTYSLPKDYNPGGLTAECAAAFEELRHGAAEDGLNIFVVSGFRSYSTQEQLYKSYVEMYGKDEADRFSARPGHSEHQTGLAIDCNYAGDNFIGTPEAIWLEEHCYEYGFIIRYPQGKESITGYKYEPWHIRYIGDMAQTISESGLTLEEYYDITSQYN